MLKKLDASSGKVVGYQVEGKVTAEDYKQLEPEILALVNQYHDVYLLLDLQQFAGEEVKAWLPDLKFGRHFHDKVAKLAVVGDKKWEEWLTVLAAPFYAKHAKFFHTAETDKAWDWLRKNE